MGVASEQRIESYGFEMHLGAGENYLILHDVAAFQG